MKKYIITIFSVMMLGSCDQQSRDTQTSHYHLQEKLGTNNIYDINCYDHIVFSDTSIYYYKTERWGKIEYKNRIK